MLGFFSAMEVAASGLTAERTRMNTVASNMANARTTRTEGGGPYRRLDPVFATKALATHGADDPFGRAVSLVQVPRVVQDTRDPLMVYEPGHPDADGQGYVQYPNVNIVEEMVNMISASRAYDAGISTVESIKGMARSALSIGK